MVEPVTYRAGIARCRVVNAATYFEYDCGPLQARRIEKSWIVAIGISDDRHLTDNVMGGATMQRWLGVKGGLGGLLIAYREPGAGSVRLATVAFDFGLEACSSFTNAMIEEFRDRYVGTDTRDALLKKMGINRTKENLLIAAILVAVALFAFAMVRS